MANLITPDGQSSMQRQLQTKQVVLARLQALMTIADSLSSLTGKPLHEAVLLVGEELPGKQELSAVLRVLEGQ